MKFSIKTTDHFYEYQEDRDKLSKLGFTFKESEYRRFRIDEADVFHEINTLEELINFIKEYGEIVMTENSIEIYNDYRE